MKRLRIKIQCRCEACGKVWMDRQQLIFCPSCIENGKADEWKAQFGGKG